MATHVRPELEKKPLYAYVNSPRLDQYARKAVELLNLFPQLKVWEVQFKPEGIADTAWYVGFASREDPYVMNFKITPSNLNVEFRFSQYLPENIFGLLNWQNTSWRYADFKKFGLNEVASMIKQYLGNIQNDFNEGKLKQGGRSFAEKMIHKTLVNIFPGTDILTNRRPDAERYRIKQGWLKVLKGMCGGVRYLKRFNMDAGRFHEHILQACKTYRGTVSLLDEYRTIPEVGVALAPNFFSDLGYKEFCKPDVHVCAIINGLEGTNYDEQQVFERMLCLAEESGVPPRQLDKVFYLAGSGNFYLAGKSIGDKWDGPQRRKALIEHLRISQDTKREPLNIQIDSD